MCFYGHTNFESTIRTASVFKVNIGINDAAEVRSFMRPAFGCSDSEF
jgi:hypothetical protein